MMPSWGHCTFCGQEHERGDARTAEDCDGGSLEELIVGRSLIHRTPLAETLERSDGEET